MDFDVFSNSIVGYKNIIKNKTSQDYCEYKKIENGIICSLADGHSSDFFEYSHIGAKLACKASIYVLENYINVVKSNINQIKVQLLNNCVRIGINQLEYRCLVTVCVIWYNKLR